MNSLNIPRSVFYAISIVLLLNLNFAILAQRDVDFGDKGLFTHQFGGVNSRIQEIIELPNGKILSAGRTFTASATYGEIFLIQLNSDGTPDSSFGNNGISILNNFENVFRFSSLKRAENGNIFLLGTSFSNGSVISFLAKFSENGERDSTFGINGIQLISVENYSNLISFDFDIQQDGKLVVVGRTFVQSGQSEFFAGFITRFDDAGNIDNTFANDGIFTTFNAPDTEQTYLTFVKILPNGEIFAGGYIRPSGFAFHQFTKVSAEGVEVKEFGNNGRVRVRRSIFSPNPDFELLSNGDIYVTSGDGLFIFNSNGVFDRFQELEYASQISAVSTNSIGEVFVRDSMSVLGNVVIRYSENFNPLNFVEFEFNGDSFFGRSNDKILLGGEVENGSSKNAAIAQYLNSNNRFIRVRGRRNDFDGDTKTDIGVCSSKVFITCSILRSHNNSVKTFLVLRPTIPFPTFIPEDYDGSGSSDLGSWNIGSQNSPIQGHFQVIPNGHQSSNPSHPNLFWGLRGDIPLGGDYDDDGKTDYTVYRNGTWYIFRSSDETFRAYSWGLPTDKPVPADFNGDGKDELAIYRPNDGNWWILDTSSLEITAFHFGIAEDKPVPADYDGDGLVDYAVYRPSEGIWYLYQTNGGFAAYRFGIASDIPVPGDYDGDRKSDIAVYRQNESNWYLLKSTEGFEAINFGSPGDNPLTTAYSAN